MKKVLKKMSALLLMAILMLNMSVAAFAAEENEGLTGPTDLFI